MNVIFKNGDVTELPEEEKQAYIKYVKEKYPDEIIDEIIIGFDDDGYANLEIHKHSAPFIRIRRVSGYLSKITKMNNAKQSEVAERVPHN